MKRTYQPNNRKKSKKLGDLVKGAIVEIVGKSSNG